MSKLVKLYCEGTAKSYDYKILEKVIDGLPNLSAPMPIGGKSGRGAIQFDREHGVNKPDFYVFFRDRDFDAEIPSSPQLTIARPNKKGRDYVYYSYRITIENYLLDSATFLQFAVANSSRDVHVAKAISQNHLQTKTDAEKLFIEAAQKIRYYQALRHTMGNMRFDTNFGTSWVEKGKSGKRPPDLEDDQLCKENAWKSIEEKQKKVSTEWSKEEFERVLNSFLARFDETFFQQLQFLVEFQGKDFAASLQSLLPVNFPMETYYKFALKQFDYTRFPDLVSLRKILIQEKHLPH